MKAIQHYYKEKVYYLGKWSLLPGDSCSWHFIESALAFKKTFGFGKGLLLIHKKESGYQHCFVPVSFFKKLGDYLDKLRKKDHLGVQKKFKKFYKQKDSAIQQIDKLKENNPSKLSNTQLGKKFRQIRKVIHEITVYDQFGWLMDSSDYWETLFDGLLVKKLKLKKNSTVYNDVLFSLVKPEEISTTLLEKLAVLRELLKIKNRASSIKKSAKKLSNKFGWMPVFAYGELWDEKHYEIELKSLQKTTSKELKVEIEKLQNYSDLRNIEIAQILNKYDLKPNDVQLFVEFGLILDARNEAEYALSYATFYLLPLYREIAKRLNLSINQVRYLNEQELIACLNGQSDPHLLLEERRKSYTWGYNKKMDKLYVIPEKEGEKLFKHVISNSVNTKNSKQNTKGITASPGIVEGRVRLVEHPQQCHKVENGDIMFSFTTTVDYLPAMKKAAGFVTESGGLTCHAAVVAREFGVPCIVSYRGAISKFKDGDKVELDADQGTIKKIK